MRSYYSEKVKVGGLLEFKVEMWREHGHAMVYSNDEPLFDGYAPEANKRFRSEVERLCKVAESHGFSYEIIK
jgi:hypothetical protein